MSDPVLVNAVNEIGQLIRQFRALETISTALQKIGALDQAIAERTARAEKAKVDADSL